MNIDQLKYYIATVDCGSINRAAKEQLLTQSAISQSISNLELEIGAKLLIRNNQGVILTTIGQIVYDEAKSLIDAVETTLNRWKSIACDNSECDGDIRIAAYPGICGILREVIIPNMAASYPGIVISVFEERFKENEIVMMEKHNATICLGTCSSSRFGKIKSEIISSGYNVDILFSDIPMCVYLSKRNRLANLSELREAELKELPLAFFADEFVPGYAKYFDQNKLFRFQQRGAMLKFVADNNAACVFPRDLFRNDRSPQSKKLVPIRVAVDDAENFPDVNQYVIHRPNAMLTKAERIILNALYFYIDTVDEK